jgi:tRNA U34 5-methylaminomethyl-2-thiouridine-forming methyltransferase MnmC
MSFEPVITEDGSHTLYSSQFNQHYHNRKDGALNESLSKHIIPAFNYFNNEKKELNILDICFGIGYNTLATLYYIKQNNLDIKVNIYSPEFDLELIHSLKDFIYPKEFNEFIPIIKEISTSLKYEDNQIKIEVFNGDAREYIKTLSNIHIIYQDAFSSDVNKMLWTKEYFNDIAKLSSSDTIITTYSIATPVRLSIWENGFNIYEYKKQDTNKSTIALNKKEIDIRYKYIDMELKLKRNPSAKPLTD